MDETVAESLSYLLGAEFVKEVNVPNGMERLRYVQGTFSQQGSYRFVTAAQRFAQQNGIQVAFDLFMENPELYMERIKKY